MFAVHRVEKVNVESPIPHSLTRVGKGQHQSSAKEAEVATGWQQGPAGVFQVVLVVYRSSAGGVAALGSPLRSDVTPGPWHSNCFEPACGVVLARWRDSR